MKIREQIKKGIAVLLASILCSVVIFPVRTEASSTRLGDVNNDGLITSADARLCLRYSVYLEDLSLEACYACDLNNDGYVNSDDARNILRVAVRLDSITSFAGYKDKNSSLSKSDLPSGAKILYLTFDDGPSAYTSEILDILDEYDAKATFFVINSTTYASEYANIVNRGHTIALHSYSHDYSKIYSSTSAYFYDLQQISDVVYYYTGVRSKLIRFPGGSSNTVSRSYSYGIMSKLVSQVTEAGYTYFDWNAANDDATGENLTAEQLYYRAIAYASTKAGSEVVMLMHDTNAKGNTVKSLPWIIEYYQDLGYYCIGLDSTSATAHHSVNN